MVWILNHRVVLGDIQKTCNCFFLEEEARMTNFLSLRATLEDLYLSNSYKKIAVSCFEKKRPVF